MALKQIPGRLRERPIIGRFFGQTNYSYVVEIISPEDGLEFPPGQDVWITWTYDAEPSQVCRVDLRRPDGTWKSVSGFITARRFTIPGSELTDVGAYMVRILPGVGYDDTISITATPGAPPTEPPIAPPVEPPVTTYATGIGIWDEAVPKYKAGTLIVDGAQQKVGEGRYLILDLPKSRHTLDLVIPSGYEWVKWAIYHWGTGEKMGESVVRPLSISIDGDYFIRAHVKLPVIESALTISAPDTVLPREPFTTLGGLTRTDTGEGINDRTINVFYNDIPLGSTTTGADGSYAIDCVIPESGTYTLKAVFPSTAVYSPQVATQEIGVGVLLPVRERVRNFIGRVGNGMTRRQMKRRRIMTKFRGTTQWGMSPT